ncbi:MAG: EutP/PduV family microcompartment system protein [Synergistaceae bacterium]|jgi:ethanolamine utilization protein EutP|nr:EutP/PduV family microcompartment system protein [Synergistaceae bacterium]
MKKTILIGKIGSGKTTLIQRVERRAIAEEKTQMVVYNDFFIDTPGEYVEIRSLYRVLIVTASDADVIAFAQSCIDDEIRFAPGLASVFPKEVIGIVTKIDAAADDSDIIRAREILELAGAGRIFEVSALMDMGVNELVNYLNER